MGENPEEREKALVGWEWSRLNNAERAVALQAIKKYAIAYNCGEAPWTPSSVFLRDKIFLKYL